MKLLDNVLWDIEGKKAVKWRTENESFYNLPDSPYPHRIRKSESRPLTVDEQAHYLYDLCCKPDSRVGDLAELNEACHGWFGNAFLEHAANGKKSLLTPDEVKQRIQNVIMRLKQTERKTKIIDTSKWEMKP